MGLATANLYIYIFTLSLVWILVVKYWLPRWREVPCRGRGDQLQVGAGHRGQAEAAEDMRDEPQQPATDSAG